jgi:methionyl-tRNA synthetase
MSARYITTTLPYVNDVPHLGHALEFVQADVLARAARLSGDEVFFSTGTDEHGQKVSQKAVEKNEDIMVFVNRHAEEFKKLVTTLNLSTDAFIRTTDPAHINAAQEMWRRCSKDLYEKTYTGLYCIGCESFKTEKEIVEGKCVDHPNNTLSQVSEKNWFFNFKKYEKNLLDYLSREDSIVPEWRRREAISFVESGLEDFSVSREKSRLSWGIPVPGDDTQVMYVWFDALTNYISTLGWPQHGGNFEKFWVNGKTLQVAGKDQVRFQSLMWQAMLFSAGIKNTDTIFYHGFIKSGGQKMSKTVGNVISPYELVEKYGTEATRYLLLRHVHPFDDSDITWERLDEWYTANLVNGLGNLVARVMKMSETYAVAMPDNAYLPTTFSISFDLTKYMNSVWNDVQHFDAVIQKEEPFKKIKTDEALAKETIRSLKNGLVTIARALSPALPETSKKILDAVYTNKKPENLFSRLP